MKRTVSLIALLVLAIAGLVSFLIWAERRPPSHYLSDLRTHIISSPRPENSPGNLLLVRPQLYPSDFQSTAQLRLKLAAALDQAQNAGLLTPETLVALPEHIGTWLLARGEKAEFYQARTRQQVRDWLLLGNPLLATRALLLNLDAERLDEALLRMKAEQMARDYQQLFAGLASEYRVTLLAGSILLPAPYLQAGELHSGDGPLRNASLVFNAEGQVQGELYSEPWPWRAQDGVQQVQWAQQVVAVERDWLAGHPQSRLRLATGTYSPPLFLRGQLDWPIGGATRHIHLIPDNAEQASDAPGSHLLNIWIPPA